MKDDWKPLYYILSKEYPAPFIYIRIKKYKE